MYLLDTNVILELRRPKPHGTVIAWVANAAEQDLFLSALTLAEIQAGIELTREQDQAKADELENWLNQVAATHQILSMDGSIFRTWAKLMHRRSNTLYEDAMIAATAKVHHLTVVTRNIKDFQHFDVPLLDPFTS